MAFMLKKKRYKFQVELCLEELSEVSYSKGVLFAKIRQLDGGSFTELSKRKEVRNHRVQYSENYKFPCKMNANVSSGILETCKCRISIRMEEKGGRNFRKLGFVDINLAEYAGAGPSTQRYILQPYDSSHRLDNSIVRVSLNITLKEGDTIFQRPLTRQQPITLPGEDAHLIDDSSGLHKGKNPTTTNSLTTVSTSTSLTGVTTTVPLGRGNLTVPSGLSDNLVKPSSMMSNTVPDQANRLLDEKNLETAANGSHTRNSSATSQVSQTSVGYESQNSQQASSLHGGNGILNGPGHSRHSSSGESSTHGRNLSQGSSDTGFFGGSLEKEKRRKQQKLDEGRIDAEEVINEIMEGVDLDKVSHEEAETSGLQLYVSKDGSVTFDKRNSSRADLQPVVIKSNWTKISEA